MSIIFHFFQFFFIYFLFFFSLVFLIYFIFLFLFQFVGLMEERALTSKILKYLKSSFIRKNFSDTKEDLTELVGDGGNKKITDLIN